MRAPGLPRRLRAASHREAYHLWASEFRDPALMANRDARTTRRKLERVAAQLPLGPQLELLDVGPGDGTLFRLVAGRVARCCGVDPSDAAIAKLRELLADLPNVELARGDALHVPYPNERFDVVVVNSVLQMLDGSEEIAASLRELRRVCRPGGCIFVGELPFRSELGGGIPRHLARKLRELGPGHLLRLLFQVYLRPLLRGEPLVLYPARNLHVPTEAFVSLCEELGLRAQARRHRELRADSTTRNDYWLRRGEA